MNSPEAGASRTKWEVFMFFVTALVVTYVFSTAAATYRYFSIDFDPDTAIAPLSDARLPDAAQSIEIRTSDGEKLIAWHVRRDNSPLVIFFHGDGDNLAATAPRLRNIVASGFALLALEYRGFGGSTGRPTEAGLYIDADAAWLKAIELGYAPEQIALLGESYGAGVALNLATKRKVKAIAIEGSYMSAAEALADRFWGFPVRVIMRNRVRSDLFVRDIHVPLLIVHGENDGINPIKNARDLFAAANEPKQFLGVANTGHLALEDASNMQFVTQWLWRQFGEAATRASP